MELITHVSGKAVLRVLNLNFWGIGWPLSSDKEVRWADPQGHLKENSKTNYHGNGHPMLFVDIIAEVPLEGMPRAWGVQLYKSGRLGQQHMLCSSLPLVVCANYQSPHT